MKNKLTILVCGIVMVLSGTIAANAQAPTDAYRNVQSGISGTAKAQAMGGAMGAVGADPTAVYINPAGSNLFSRSSLGFSFNVGRGKNTVTTDETTFNSELGFSTVGNISYFTPGFSFTAGNNNYLGITFGVSAGQEFNFKRDYNFGADHPRFSITDMFAQYANDLDLGADDYLRTDKYDPFISGAYPMIALGMNGDIIEGVTETNPATGQTIEYFQSKFLYKDGEGNIIAPMQIGNNTLYVSERGDRYFTDFNIGVNYDNRYMFGASLRVGSTTYSQSSMFTERFIGDYGYDNSSLEYGTYLDVSGASLGANLGFLMAIGDYGRIGISYLTPQYGLYKETYGGSVKSNLSTVTNPNDREYLFETGEYRNDYGMILPGKLTLSAMAFLSRYGMISYDFEYRNLGNSKILLGNTLSTNGVTDFIKEDYGHQLSHRVGLELRPLSWLTARAGYMYSGNPMKNELLKTEHPDGLDFEVPASGMITNFVLPRSYQSISGGLGFNIGRSMTLDLAYVHEITKQKAYPYSGYTSPNDPENSFIAVKGGDLKATRGSAVIGLTFRF